MKISNERIASSIQKALVEYGVVGMKWGISGGAGKSGKLTDSEKGRMRATMKRYPSAYSFRKAALASGAAARVRLLSRRVNSLKKQARGE